MHLLIVDDSGETRALIARLLAAEGFSAISEADSAEAALERLGVTQPLRRPWPPVDLILLDIDLPGIDGVEACRRIRADIRFQDTLIVMVTGISDDDCLQRSFEAGAVDYITKPIRRVELIARLRSLRTLKAEMDRRKGREVELLRVKAALEEANQALARLAALDGLTGVPNRRSFERALAREWERARRTARPVALALIDIDFFKRYNDTYGHQVGDASLVAVAKALTGVLAERSTDLLARYGGEEFAAVLPELDQESGAEVAQRFRSAVAGLRLAHAGSEVSPWVTISVGIASRRPGAGESPQILLSQADRALYQAKAQGRDRVVCFAEAAP